MNRTHLRDFRLWIVVSLLLALFGVSITDSTRLVQRAIRPGLYKQLDDYNSNLQAPTNVHLADGKQGYESRDNEQGYESRDNEQGYESLDNEQGYKMEDNESSNGDNPMMTQDNRRGKYDDDDEEEEEGAEEERWKRDESSRKREAVDKERDSREELNEADKSERDGDEAYEDEDNTLEEEDASLNTLQNQDDSQVEREDRDEVRGSKDESANTMDNQERDDPNDSSENEDKSSVAFSGREREKVCKRDRSTRDEDLGGKTESDSAASNDGSRDVKTPIKRRCKWHVSNHEWQKMNVNPEQEVEYDLTLTDEAHMYDTGERASNVGSSRDDNLSLEKRNSPVRFMPLRFPKRRHSHEAGDNLANTDKRCDDKPGGNKTEDKEKPGTSDKKPGTCDKKPGTCDKKPATCEKKPGTCDKKPGTCEKKPGTCDKKPGTCDKKPGTCDVKPGPCTKEQGKDKDKERCNKEPKKQNKCDDEKKKPCSKPRTKAKDYCGGKTKDKDCAKEAKAGESVKENKPVTKGREKSVEGSKTYRAIKWYPDKRARNMDSCPKVSKRKEEDDEEREMQCKEDYGYGPTNGPEKWVDKYPDCGGDRQSPINLDTSTTRVEYEPLLKWRGYDALPCRATLTNNGKSVTLIPIYEGPAPFIYDSISKQEFVFGQLHFHWGSDNKHGSEHTVNFKQYAMEMHCVHYRRELGGLEKASKVPGGLTIIGILFQVGKSNPGLRNIQWSFPKVRTAPKSSLVAPFPLSHLIHPFSKHFLTYNGSITTPPCTESARWIIDQKISHLSKSQLNRFRRFKNAEGERITRNYRPVQPLNCRQVIQAA